MAPRWSLQELKILAAMKRDGESVRKAARILGRSLVAVEFRWKLYPPFRNKKRVTKQILEKIRKFRELGYSRCEIARRMGCHDRTIGRWMKQYGIS